MAVDSTPDRSFSLLFRSSRAADATTGCDLSPRWGIVIMARKVISILLRVGKKIRHAGQGLVRLGIEDMQDRSDQERMAGFLPMVPAFQRTLGIDQNVGDVLHIAHLGVAAPDLEQRIASRGFRIRRVEQKYPAEPAAPARREGPVLALDVVDND